MKFICAQPAIDYYTWQVEVMLNNFIRNGVNPNNIEIVSGYKDVIPKNWVELAKKYNTVRFFFYEDTRYKPSYISSIRPHILYKHWLKFPELSKEVIFYHDCDIILSKPYSFQILEEGDICFVSNTVSYIGARYIKSKGEHYLDLMTNLVGVNKEYVIQQEHNSGGAQYIIKNIGSDFWYKVYHDCENLFRIVNDQIKKDKQKDPSIHEIQIWCADMWAVLWNLWFFDKQVKVTEKMSFSWATSPINEWDRHSIFHNAGVIGNNTKCFYKGAYMSKLPYDIKIEDYSPDFCSYKYAEEILKTKEVTCLK